MTYRKQITITAAAHRRSGLSLLELLAALTILGVLAAALVPRLSVSTSETKSGSCAINRRVIEIQTALWHRDHGSWPSASLADIGGDRGYFPDGVPICPIDQSDYQIDTSSGQVIGHRH
tara:strand:- start:235188 stop:235544 length:357 start_codon:yes stop_codon:yes gene_type:complete